MVLRICFANILDRSARLRWRLGVLLGFAGLALVSVFLWTHKSGQAAETEELQTLQSDEPIQPIEAMRNLNREKVELGKRLFEDSRLSHNNQLSCASCHIVSSGGTDHKKYSVGIYGAVGVINAPTVLNSGLNFSQFWDGREETLENQIDEPVLSSTELGSTWSEVVNKLREVPKYEAAFRRIYKEPLQSGHIKNCIAEYERSLSTPHSRFDRYLRHEANVLSDREQQGYHLFKSLGCVSCHQGSGIGGNMYQRVGVMASYFEDRGHLTKADLGRYNVTKNPRDRYMFKVPSLRNVALTAPYFHDGTASTLTDAVAMMAKYQLGYPLTETDTESIVEFLRTLTGELYGYPL